MPRRVLPGFLFGVALSAVCLWYAFRGVDLDGLGREMGRVGAPWVAASILAGLASLVIRGVRWRYLLPNGGMAPLGALVSATFIGIMANNVLPARLGEVVRAWVFARHDGRPMAVVFASIVLERILDVIALVAILGLTLLLSPPLAGSGGAVFRRMGLIGLLLSSAFIAGLVIVVRYENLIHRATDRLAGSGQPGWKVRALNLFRRFIEGLCALRTGRQTFQVVWLSLLVWAAGVVSFYVLAKGFDLGLTLAQTSLVFAAVLFGIAVPSAPGFVGTFHGFCVAGLTLVSSTDPTTAAAYATLLHGSQWLAINMVGLGCLLADRVVTWAGVSGLVREG